MAIHDPTPDDLYDPPLISRFKVEAAMLEMIERLKQQGLSQADIALSLADAAEDYIIRLSAVTTDDSDDEHAGEHRH